MKTLTRGERWAAGALVALLVASRLFAALYHRPSEPIVNNKAWPWVGGDAVTYDRPAWNLVSGNGYSSDLDPPYAPSVIRPPTYPLFLALVYKIAGHDTRPVHLAHAVLDAATCLMLFALARRLFRRARTALFFFAALVFLFPPSYYVPSRLSEPLAAFLLTLLTFVWVLGKQEPRLQALALGGISGALLLCRPVFVVLPFAAAWGIWTQKENRSLRRGVAALCLLSGCFLVWSPWVLRNAMAFHRFIPLSEGGGGLSLWMGTWSRRGELWEKTTLADGRVQTAPPERAFRSPEEKETALRLLHEYSMAHYTNGAGISDADEQFGRLALQKIREGPLSWFFTRAEGVFFMLRQEFFLPSRLKNYVPSAVNDVLSALFALGMALGAAMACRMEPWRPALLVFFTSWLVHFPTHAEARYLVPAYGFVMLLAFLALEKIPALFPEEGSEGRKIS